MYWRYGAALLVSLASTPALALLGLDSTPPTVTIVKPASGVAVSGQAALEVRADDGLLGSGVSRVEYQIDTAEGVWTALSGSLLSTTYRGTWNTLVVADGSHSVYVRAIDGDGNQRLVYAVAVVANPPAAPTGVKVAAQVGASNGGYLDLSWSSNTEMDLVGYNVYRSTTSGGPYTKVAGTSVSFLRDPGLSNGTPYYYVVAAVDVAGNESPRSGEVSGTPTDTRAPLASGMTAVAGPTSADIGWTTDEPASSQVEYGTSSALGSATGVDPARTTSHGVSLTGLQPNRTYFYRVRSVDASGNAGVSQVLSFSTGVDLPPTVSIVNVAEGAVLQGPITLQAQAGDDFGVSKVEYTVGGLVWNVMGFNSLTGFYEVRLDTNTLGEGAQVIGVRASDSARQVVQTAVNVTVDRGAPVVDLISPVVDAHLAGGVDQLVQVSATDSGSGVTAVEWQLYAVPLGVELEEAPQPDPALWQPLTLNAQSGMYETNWLAPTVVVEQVIYLYARATDGLGKSTTFVREVTVLATGRDFVFTGSGGQELSGTVAIAPDTVNGGNRIGLQLIGRFVTPGGRYRLTVSGEGASHTVEFTADARGRGVAEVEEATGMTDVFSATLTPSGPGF
ncbi:purple acid phosphatase-like protein [Archangium gephyra]|uniref:Endo-1,4-beta-xylanase A n=1 Tax=Archangium gephyra TaxID=48 RepID=A0AAC8TG76_9BACT|nr:Ig-like domain-containing protein [Archangium gephyra]AKJ04862.1 Endo-1,4-beta-xylanase A precursor [Archangium gephyra]REG37094.1 purple acid phosphatase-like protein [Archangium gephyra]